jgi:hypothetical protein
MCRICAKKDSEHVALEAFHVTILELGKELPLLDRCRRARNRGLIERIVPTRFHHRIRGEEIAVVVVRVEFSQGFTDHVVELDRDLVRVDVFHV